MTTAVILTLILAGFGLGFLAMHLWIYEKVSIIVSSAISLIALAMFTTGFFIASQQKAEYAEQIEQCMLLKIEQDGMDAETAEFVCEER